MNNSFLTIAFFWVGENIEIPNTLVKSIRLIMGNNVNVVQLTNHMTKEVNKVDAVKRYELPKAIMLARLMAYSKFENETQYTFFCDADSIFINKLVVPKDTVKNILLAPRLQDGKINHNYPEFYEEFVGKRANEVMPFLFGAIITKGNQKLFFKDLLDICLNLPYRFHRWYGDQYALSQIVNKGFNEYEMLDANIYLNVIREPLSYEYLRELLLRNVQFITFKGPQSKIYLDSALNMLEDFYNQDN